MPKGGLTYGPSHEKGGIPMKVSSTGQDVELEGGEGVINKRSMADPDLHTFNGKKMSNCQIVSAINEQHGGRKMNCDDAAVGGASRMENGGDVDYRGSHTAPGPDEDFDDNTLDNPTGVFGDDIYSPMAARYFGHGDKKDDQAVIKIIQSYRGKPDKKVTIYRAIPKSVKSEIIRDGDWITIYRPYAVHHGEGYLDEYKVIEDVVSANEVYTDGNSPFEWGVFRKSSMADGGYIGRKTKILMKEGYPQKQALAIAYDMERRKMQDGGSVKFDTKRITGEANIHKNNTHFVVHKPTNSIVEAYDYRDVDPEELRDFKDDYFFYDVEENFAPDMTKFRKRDFAVVKKSGLAKRGIDLNDYKIFQGEKFKHGGRMKQGYNARLDESLGMRHRGRKRQRMRARRDESKGMERSMGRRPYQSVRSMDRMGHGGMTYQKGGQVSLPYTPSEKANYTMMDVKDALKKLSRALNRNETKHGLAAKGLNISGRITYLPNIEDAEWDQDTDTLYVHYDLYEDGELDLPYEGGSYSINLRDGTIKNNSLSVMKGQKRTSPSYGKIDDSISEMVKRIEIADKNIASMPMAHGGDIHSGMKRVYSRSKKTAMRKMQDGGQIDVKSVVKVAYNTQNGREYYLQDFEDNADAYFGDLNELTVEEAKDWMMGFLPDDSIFVIDADDKQEFHDGLDELKAYKRDNTYNYDWWGGVIDYGIIYADTGRGDNLYGTDFLLVARTHRGGDPRGNYNGIKIYSGDNAAEQLPWYVYQLMLLVNFEDGEQFACTAENEQAYYWYVNDDPTGTFEEDETVSSDDIEEAFDIQIW